MQLLGACIIVFAMSKLIVIYFCEKSQELFNDYVFMLMIGYIMCDFCLFK